MITFLDEETCTTLQKMLDEAGVDAKEHCQFSFDPGGNCPSRPAFSVEEAEEALSMVGDGGIVWYGPYDSGGKHRYTDRHEYIETDEFDTRVAALKQLIEKIKEVKHG